MKNLDHITGPAAHILVRGQGERKALEIMSMKSTVSYLTRLKL